VDVSGWIGEGWRIFWRAPSVYFLSMMIICLCMLIAAKFPVLLFFVARPFILGFYLVVADQDAGRPFRPERVFGGFLWILPCLAADMLIAIFSAFGLIFLVIPGMVVSSWYLLTWLFMVDGGLGFWGSMEASRQVARKDMFGFFLFFVAIICINILGALFLGVGLFITMPVSAAAIYAAYKDLAGLKTIGAFPSENSASV
jgi:uncharacterized membrane protein